MRIRTGLAMLALTSLPALAQVHEGFHFSGDLGVGWGDITQSDGPYPSSVYSGAGLQMDFRVGGVVSPNLVLTGDLLVRSTTNPTIRTAGASGSPTGNWSVGDAIFGGGLTYYFMPANIFLGATVGLGNFTRIHDNKNYSTKLGLGFQVRAGKEWWFSKRWALGLTAGVTVLNAEDQDSVTYSVTQTLYPESISANPTYHSGSFSSTQYFVALSVSFN